MRKRFWGDGQGRDAGRHRSPLRPGRRTARPLPQDPPLRLRHRRGDPDGGADVVTVPTDFGVVGLAICYDLRFPELFRALLDAGAELIVVPCPRRRGSRTAPHPVTGHVRTRTFPPSSRRRPRACASGR
ncbi:nitrilase-related carbon-nitrogen hydrolase [Streptomyces sp. NPDC002386]